MSTHRADTTLHETIYRVVDDDGHVLNDIAPYEGDYEIGDQIDADGRHYRVVAKFTDDGYPDVVWVKTVAEAV